MQKSYDLSAGRPNRSVTLFLCGDVMTGRGVDQILPHPGDPTLHEQVVKSATRYVDLAERHSGPIPEPVDFDYVWSDALGVLERVAPEVRIVNLETAVTTSDEHWDGKAIHYRMHPKNVPCLTAAGIDCCVLSNNHVLDWGYAGLEETLETLAAAGIATTGAGRSLEAAQRPAVFDLNDRGRVLVFGVGSSSSGIPPQWAATADRPGVHLVSESAPDAAARIQEVVERFVEPGDLVVVSIHWGRNWGYDIPPQQRSLAHALVDDAGVDVVHGHSSHHVKGVEVYRDRPILYGCGDFLTDYEGIRGHEQFRDTLGLMYFPSLHAETHALTRFRMHPTRIEQMQVTRADTDDAEWLAAMLNREGGTLGTHVERSDDDVLTLHPD